MKFAPSLPSHPSQGLWSASRLPKVMDKPRPKVHWDYLLEEMQWLATDFAQEARWKRAAAKKCADAVVRHFARLEEKKRREEEEEQNRGRVLARMIASDVMTQFWGKVRAVSTIKVKVLLMALENHRRDYLGRRYQISIRMRLTAEIFAFWLL